MLSSVPRSSRARSARGTCGLKRGSMLVLDEDSDIERAHSACARRVPRLARDLREVVRVGPTKKFRTGGLVLQLRWSRPPSTPSQRRHPFVEGEHRSGSSRVPRTLLLLRTTCTERLEAPATDRRGTRPALSTGSSSAGGAAAPPQVYVRTRSRRSVDRPCGAVSEHPASARRKHPQSRVVRRNPRNSRSARSAALLPEVLRAHPSAVSGRWSQASSRSAVRAAFA